SHLFSHPVEGPCLMYHHFPFRKRHSPMRPFRPTELPGPAARQPQRLRGCEALEPRNLLAATVVADYVVTQNWGSGFEGEIKVANQQTTAVANWTLEFDFGAAISSIWDGRIVSHTGTHYVIANAGWNSTLAAGGQASFGFIAAPGGNPGAPTNYLLNGK